MLEACQAKLVMRCLEGAGLFKMPKRETASKIRGFQKNLYFFRQFVLTNFVYSAIIHDCAGLRVSVTRRYQIMLEKLKTGKKVVGMKQLRRALNDRRALVVFLADDADPALTEPVRARCEQEGVPVVQVPTMLALGRACEISVAASAAALVR